LIFYKNLYFAHVHNKLTASNDQRTESWQNFVDLFEYLLSKEFDVTQRDLTRHVCQAPNFQTTLISICHCSGCGISLMISVNDIIVVTHALMHTDTVMLCAVSQLQECSLARVAATSKPIGDGETWSVPGAVAYLERLVSKASASEFASHALFGYV
jgi:hypothetical protein